MAMNIFVDPDQSLSPELQDGLSWETAFRLIPTPITVLGEDVFIYCKLGILNMGFTVLGGDNVGGVVILGGYRKSLTGTYTSDDGRDTSTGVTIIKPTSIGRGLKLLKDDVLVDGFGFYCSGGEDVLGGAIYAKGYGLNINNNRFLSCNVTGLGQGGGIFIDASGAEQDLVGIHNCLFYNCNARDGGGVAVKDADTVTLSQCTFIDCDASHAGGAVFADNVNKLAIINKTTATSCDAPTSGGAFHINNNCERTVIEDDELTECSSAYGSAIYLGQTPTSGFNSFVSRCRITGNTSANGAIYLLPETNPSIYIRDNLITDNIGSGIVYTNVTGHTPIIELINNTIANNTGFGVVGALVEEDGLISLYNNQIVGNTSGACNRYFNAVFNNNIDDAIPDCVTSDDNLNIDPKFKGGGAEPYYLNEFTACINGGIATPDSYSTVDLTGYTRSGVPDIGCLENRNYIEIPDSFDCGLYNVNLNPHGDSSAKIPLSFKIPKLLQLEPKIPFWNNRKFSAISVGSEVQNQSATGSIVEYFSLANNGSISMSRETLQQTTPTWESDFAGHFKDVDYSYLGSTNELLTGISINFDFRYKGRYGLDYLLYRVLGKNLDDDDARVYNVWVESKPAIDIISTPVVAWVNTPINAGDVISVAHMRELIKLLNYMIFEARSPLTCPVYGAALTKFLVL
jgi:hypothetical protein